MDARGFGVKLIGHIHSSEVIILSLGKSEASVNVFKTSFMILMSNIYAHPRN